MLQADPRAAPMPSSVFRDMLSNPALSPSANETNSVIPLDTTLKVMEVLLDLCTDPDEKEKPKWKDVVSAFELCRKHDFAVAGVRVKRNLKDYVKTDSWDVFVFASQQDFLDLAKEAISHFDYSGGPGGAPPLAVVSPAYIIALGKAMGQGFRWWSFRSDGETCRTVAERYRAERFRLE
jgi:hypothetical protein